MSRIIDADKLDIVFRDSDADGWSYEYITRVIEEQPTIHAIPIDKVKAGINKVEDYICNCETDTVKAQGMAKALDMIEKALSEVENGSN